MKTVYFIFSAMLLVVSIATFVMGDYEAARHAVVCSLLCQILLRLEEKSDA